MIRFLIIASLVIFSFIILDFTACTLYSGKVNTFFEHRAIQPSDAAVVFFGDYDRILGLGSETKKRVEHVSELYKTGKVKNIICVGGAALLKKKGYPGSKVMREYLIGSGIPEDRIFFDNGSYDTFSNWEQAKPIIVSHNWKEIILVSSAYHLYRIAGFTTDDSLTLFYSPYSKEILVTPGNFLDARRWIHHEWKAYAAQKILPEKYYRGLLRYIRE